MSHPTRVHHIAFGTRLLRQPPQEFDGAQRKDISTSAGKREGE